MSRIGETIRRTWQLAHVMKAWAGADEGDDDARVLRYLAKVTAEPALVHGIEADVGSLRPGRLADIVLWRPAALRRGAGADPEGRCLRLGALGQGNATVEGVEPVGYGPHWGSLGAAAAALSTTFVSGAALEGVIGQRLGSREAVRGRVGSPRPPGDRWSTTPPCFRSRSIPVTGA